MPLEVYNFPGILIGEEGIHLIQEPRGSLASSLEVTTSSNDIIAAQSNYIQAVMNVISAQTALDNLLNKQ